MHLPQSHDLVGGGEWGDVGVVEMKILAGKLKILAVRALY